DRAFVIVQPQPVHGLEDRVDRGLGAALAVGVLDPQDELAAAVARLQPAVQRGARATDVQVAGGTGGEAGTTGHGRTIGRSTAFYPCPGAPRSGSAGDRGHVGEETDKPGPTALPRGARGPNPVRLHRLVHSVRGQLRWPRPRRPNAPRPSHYNPRMATLFVSDLHLDAT